MEVWGQKDSLSLLRQRSSPFRHFEPARVEPTFGSIQPKSAGWPAQLTASAFNQLGQYANSPGHRAYCYTEVAILFPSSSRNHR